VIEIPRRTIAINNNNSPLRLVQFILFLIVLLMQRRSTMTDQDKLNTLDAISNAAWGTLATVSAGPRLTRQDQEKAIQCLEIIKSTFQIKRGLERVE
jgi:hypothetical protein